MTLTWHSAWVDNPKLDVPAFILWQYYHSGIDRDKLSWMRQYDEKNLYTADSITAIKHIGP